LRDVEPPVDSGSEAPSISPFACFETATSLAMPDISSTFFGLTIAFLAPGMVGLFSLKYWSETADGVFHTILSAKANAGLFLFVVLAAVVLGLVVSAVRWLIFEVTLERFGLFAGERLKEEDKKGRWDADRLNAYRAAVDETYRYHQLYGGLVVTFPALFVGWLQTHGHWSTGELILLWIGFAALEVLMFAGALSARKRYHQATKSIFSAQKPDPSAIAKEVNR
jgi:hypothetical protein